LYMPVRSQACEPFSDIHLIARSPGFHSGQ
jgi:hypothetical protein